MSFLFSARGCTIGGVGIFLASRIGVDILSNVSRINLAVLLMESEDGDGEGEDEAVEGREDGGGPDIEALDFAFSVCRVLSAAV